MSTTSIYESGKRKSVRVFCHLEFGDLSICTMNDSNSKVKQNEADEQNKAYSRMAQNEAALER